MPENSDPKLPPIEQEQTQAINVIPFYVCSKDIKHLTDEVAAFVGGKEIVKVPASENKTKDELHDFYYICTFDFIYRYVPYYDIDKKKVMYSLEDWYSLSRTDGEPNPKIEFPSVIWHTLGGNISMNEKGLRYYDSFYGCYVPFGDDCICAYSDNQAVRVRYNFPFTSVKGQKCTTCQGQGKVLDAQGAKKGCETCNGSGKVIPFTPFGHYMKEPPTSQENETFAASPAIEFYSPDVAILQHSYETWEDLLSKAKETVNLMFIEEAQSGVAKEIDREQKYETLIKITQNFFGLTGWSLEIIEAYKVTLKDSREGSKVTEPESFSIKTEGQLITELNEMTAKETPQAFIATTSKQIADKLYANDPEAKIIVNILSKWDVLYGMSTTAISSAKATGGATLRDVMKHTQGYSILTQIAMMKGVDLTKIEPLAIIAMADAALNARMPKETLVMEEAEEDANP